MFIVILQDRGSKQQRRENLQHNRTALNSLDLPWPANAVHCQTDVLVALHIGLMNDVQSMPSKPERACIRRSNERMSSFCLSQVLLKSD